MNPLTHSASLFGPLFAKAEDEALFSTERMLGDFRSFESALTEALGKSGVIETSLAERAVAGIERFIPDVAAISAASHTDGLPAPEYVRQLKAALGEELAAAVHVGATSQDLVDTSLVLALRDAAERSEDALGVIETAFQGLLLRFADAPLMARTRMQAALEIRVADRLALWSEPLLALRKDLARLGPEVFRVQFGGPVGDRRALADQGNAVADHIANALGLSSAERSWHTDRRGLVAFGTWLATLSTQLGKIGQDIALMAQQGLDDIALAGGGKSSAMAHKSNPVLAETLVAIARWNAGQIGLLHQAALHEQERSGAAWTLEWMVLPGMCVAVLRALDHTRDLLASIERLGSG